MSFKHPEIDALVAEHAAHGEAISLLNRKNPTDEDLARRAEHPLLQDVTDVAAAIASLTARKDELLAEITQKMVPLRRQAAESQLLEEMARVEGLYGKFTNSELEFELSKATSDAAAAAEYLRLLRLEARRRKGLSKAEAEIANLSPQAKAMLKQSVAAAPVPAKTEVRG